jgi:hypothetical protein
MRAALSQIDNEANSEEHIAMQRQLMAIEAQIRVLK